MPWLVWRSWSQPASSPTLGPTPTLPQPREEAVGTATSRAPVSSSGVNDDTDRSSTEHDNYFNQDLYLDALIRPRAPVCCPLSSTSTGEAMSEATSVRAKGPPPTWPSDGFVVFSIDYPLATASQSAWYDTAAQRHELAVQWLRTNAGTFGVNPSGIALLGYLGRRRHRV